MSGDWTLEAQIYVCQNMLLLLQNKTHLLHVVHLKHNFSNRYARPITTITSLSSVKKLKHFLRQEKMVSAWDFFDK